MECKEHIMEKSCNDLVLHPHLLEALFAYKSKVSSVFRDILGIHEIHHIAITKINASNQLLTFSSTPALEFNLFNGPLWRYDYSYDPKWFRLLTHDCWQNLYHKPRYDELYYLKQIKHALPLGLSLAAQLDNQYVVYSVASRSSSANTRELFTNLYQDLYKIGQYCSNLLNPLFNHCDALALQDLAV